MMEDFQEKEQELNLKSVENDQPNIGLQTEYFHYEIGHFENPENFSDRFSFNSPPVIHEAKLMAELQNCIKGADECINMLYTYRSVAKALPMMQRDTGDDKQYNVKIYKILKPQIKKIEKIMHFIQQKTVPSIKKVFNEINSFEENFGTIISDTLFEYIIKLLDAILKLNTLKRMRDEVFLTDFTRYKMAIRCMDKSSFKGKELEDIENFSKAPMHPVHLFLLDKQFVLQSVNKVILSVNGAMKSIIMIVNHCVDKFNQEMYLFAEEKHCLLRVMVFGIYLVDGFKAGGKKSKKAKEAKEAKQLMKKFDQDKMIDLFKRYPFVPLFCDMIYNIGVDLGRCKNLSEKVWKLTESDTKKLETQFLLINLVGKIRKQFVEITADYQLCINKIKYFQKKGKEISEDLRKKIVNVSSKGLKLIANWKTSLIEQCTWKYSHGATIEQLKKIPEVIGRLEEAIKADEKNKELTIGSFITTYERAVRYNYTKEERSILVDVIAMIKGLSSLMIKHTTLLAPLIRSHIHSEIQNFAQRTLEKMIRKAKKKPDLQKRLMNLKSFIVDADDFEGEEDIKKGGFLGLKKKKTLVIDLKKRTTPGSATQILMLRTIISTLYSKRAEGMKKKILKKVDFKKEQVEKLNDFYHQSFMWIPLLDYNNSLKKASDLSWLWHREYYLQIEGKIQMPIDNSLPWMLVENIISKKNLSLMDSIFYPLSIYDDAANLSLYTLKAKHLYEEIEAEVNLVFDQFIFKLAESIYSYYKIKSSISVLGNKSGTKLNIPPSRFMELLTQKNFKLLGRSIDLNRILSKTINMLIKDNLIQCIKRFESSNLPKIVELNNLIECVRMTHLLLSPNLQLDSFDSILQHVMETSAISTHGGKITKHIANELIYDIFQNYIYNSSTQRFVKSPCEVSQEDNTYKRGKPFRITGYNSFGNKELAKSFNYLHSIFAGYLGNEHIQTMIKIIGKNSLSLLIKTIILWMENFIYTDISPYITALREGIPPKIGLDTVFGLEGSYYKYLKLFGDISSYPDLRPGVFHSFRVVGNGIAFLLLLDNNLSQSEIKTYMNAAPFMNLKPMTSAFRENRRTAKLSDEEKSSGFGNLYVTPLQKLNKSPLVSLVSSFVKDDIVKKETQMSEIMESDLIDRSFTSILECHPKRPVLSIFTFALERIRRTLLEKFAVEWNGDKTKESLGKLTSSKSFSKLWNIFQFAFAKQEKDGFQNHNIFGDGFFFCGNTITYLFGEYDRFLGFNFLNHLVALERFEIASKGSNVEKEYTGLLQNAKRYVVINDKLKAIFKKYYPLEEAASTIVLAKDPFAIDDKRAQRAAQKEQSMDDTIKDSPKKKNKKNKKKNKKKKKEEEEIDDDIPPPPGEDSPDVNDDDDDIPPPPGDDAPDVEMDDDAPPPPMDDDMPDFSSGNKIKITSSSSSSNNQVKQTQSRPPVVNMFDELKKKAAQRREKNKGSGPIQVKKTFRPSSNPMFDALRRRRKDMEDNSDSESDSDDDDDDGPPPPMDDMPKFKENKSVPKPGSANPNDLFAQINKGGFKLRKVKKSEMKRPKSPKSLSSAKSSSSSSSGGGRRGGGGGFSGGGMMAEIMAKANARRNRK